MIEIEGRVLAWLRWAAVVPAFVASYFVIHGLVIIMFRWSLQRVGIESEFFLAPLIAIVIASMVAVYAASYTAPRGEKAVAAVAAILYTLVTGYLLFPSVELKHWWDVFCSLCSLGSAFGMVASIWREEVEFMRRRYPPAPTTIYPHHHDANRFPGGSD